MTFAPSYPSGRVPRRWRAACALLWWLAACGGGDGPAAGPGEAPPTDHGADAGNGKGIAEAGDGKGTAEAGAEAAAAAGATLAPVARPTFGSEIVAFEDNVLYGTVDSTDLVYRVEGRGEIVRQPSLTGSGQIVFDETDVAPGGPNDDVALVHAAQLRHATVAVKLRVDAGSFCIAVAHNGRTKVSGGPSSVLGVSLELAPDETRLVEMSTGLPLARIDEVFPRGVVAEVAVAFDLVSQKIRIDLPTRSYEATLPQGISAPGGFALRAPPSARAAVSRVRIVDEEPGKLAYLDASSGRFLDPSTGAPACSDGCSYGGLNLPPGISAPVHGPAAIDYRHRRALYWLGRTGTTYAADIVGYAVQDLRPLHPPDVARTADVLVYSAGGNGSFANGCFPTGGSCGVDGVCLQTGASRPNGTSPPSSMCWVDWNAYDRGDLARFVVPAFTAEDRGNGTFVAYQDSHMALDGSLAELVSGVIGASGSPIHALTRHLVVHPALTDYVARSEWVFPGTAVDYLSHTHPGSDPHTALVVRDLDRAYYEIWDYGVTAHVRNLGFNLFTKSDDMIGPSHDVRTETYDDWANVFVDFAVPGRGVAPKYRWPSGTPIAVDVVVPGADGFHAVGPYPLAAGGSFLAAPVAVALP